MPEIATAKGRPRDEYGPFGKEPALPPAPERSSQSGIPASGRRQYSQWEQGEDIEVLDTQDASEVARVVRSSIEDLDTGKSTAKGVP